MRIGLIDVDGHNFPNLPLMKLSAWHKQKGDSVEWYSQMFSGHMDRVYMSKVFSFTPEYQYYVNADEVLRFGSGYCINTVDGKEEYHKERDRELPSEIELMYPDYSLYPELTKETAYGFLSRGCPRGCEFCHVGVKEGRCSHKVAPLTNFWKDQKNIILLDPNITACKDWQELFGTLIESGAWVDFSQGIDIRTMTAQKADMLKRMRIKQIHFAWDRMEDKAVIVERFREFREITGWNHRRMGVYVLTNFNTTFEQDLERIYTLRDIGYSPYVMIYNKDTVKRGADLRRMQRWVNSRVAFAAVKRFEDFR